MAEKNSDSRDFLPPAAAAAAPGKLPKYFWIWAPMLVFFGLSLLVIFSYLQRRAAIVLIKNQYDYVVTSLNDAGLDIAYDKIEFNALWPKKLVKAENFKIYTLNDKRSIEWSVSELTINGGLFSSRKLHLGLSKQQNLQYGKDNYKITLRRPDISLDVTAEGINNLIIKLYGLDISDIADIGEISFAARKIASQQINDDAPFIKTYLDIRNIKFNGLLNYPLAQDISRIYINSDIIGRLKNNDNMQAAINDWLLRNGKIEVKALTVNWAPLLLVGKGNIYFNEKFKPIIKLSTSSKALLDLINQMEAKNWLDNKGVFVAKILLGNKAYKANPEDKHLTLSTPIDYQDGEVAVEKITIYQNKN